MSSLKSEFSTESSTVFETEVTSWELTKSDLTRLKNSAPDSQDPIKYVRVNLNKSDSSSQYSLQLRPLQFVTGQLGAGYVTMELTEELYSRVGMDCYVCVRFVYVSPGGAWDEIYCISKMAIFVFFS